MSKDIKESRRLAVGKDEAQVENAMNEAESFIVGLGLDKKTTMRVRLLSEEILEMVRSMVGEFEGDFWVEAEEGECRLRLNGKADVDISKEKELISVSKDGKNASLKGFSARITQFLRHHREYISNMMTPDDIYVPMDYDYMYIGEIGGNLNTGDMMWSMHNYREYIYDDQNLTNQVEEDRDELEKSIVANLADDVRVGVKGDDISMTVIKKI